MKYNIANLKKDHKKSFFSFSKICRFLVSFFVIAAFIIIFLRLTLLGKAPDWAFHVLLGYFKWFLYASIIILFFIFLITNIKIRTLIFSLSIIVCATLLLQICVNASIITIEQKSSQIGESLGTILLRKSQTPPITFGETANGQFDNCFEVAKFINSKIFFNLISQIKKSITDSQSLVALITNTANWTGFIGKYIGGILAYKINFIAAMLIPYSITWLMLMICICLIKIRSKSKQPKKTLQTIQVKTNQQKYLDTIKTSDALQHKFTPNFETKPLIKKPEQITIIKEETPEQNKAINEEKRIQAKFADHYVGPTGEINKENFINNNEPKQLVSPHTFVNQEYKTLFENNKSWEQDPIFEEIFNQNINNETYEKIKALIIEKRWSLITIIMLKTYFKLNDYQADLIIKKLKQEKIIVPN